MRKCEDEAFQKKQLVEDQRLSNRMQDSWQSGNFWIMYAARNNFASDTIYWEKIDQRFFGRASGKICDVWRERLHLLEPGEKNFMEECVDLKLKERNTWRLTWDPDEYTVGWIERMKGIYWQKREKEEKERAEMEKEEA